MWKVDQKWNQVWCHEANWKAKLTSYIYVYQINSGHNMHGLWNTAHWRLDDIELTFQCYPRSSSWGKLKEHTLYMIYHTGTCFIPFIIIRCTIYDVKPFWKLWLIIIQVKLTGNYFGGPHDQLQWHSHGSANVLPHWPYKLCHLNRMAWRIIFHHILIVLISCWSWTNEPLVILKPGSSMTSCVCVSYKVWSQQAWFMKSNSLKTQ